MDLELADNLQRQLELTDDPEMTVMLLGRLGRLREDKLRGSAGARSRPTGGCWSCRPAHLETIEALERILPTPRAGAGGGGDARAGLPGAQRLPQPGPGAGDRGAPHPGHRAADRAAAGDRLGLRGRLRRSGEGLRGARPGAGREPGRRRDPAAASSGWPGCWAGRRPGRPLRAASSTSVGDDEVKRALYHKIADAGRGGAGRRRAGGGGLPAGAGSAAAATCEAANALERIYVPQLGLPAAGRAATSARWAWSTTSTEKKAAGLQGGQGPRGGAGEPGEGHRRLPADPGHRRERRDRARAARAALHPAGALGGPQGHLRPQGRPGHRPAARRSRCCSCWARSTTASCGDPEKAIETYSAILDIDPDDCEAVQALDRLYAQTERWFDLLSVLERQTELSPSAAEVVSLRFRIGELWREQAEGPGPGGGGLPPGAGDGARRTSRPCAALEAMMAGRGAAAGGPGAGAGLRDARASGTGWRRCTR